MGAWERGEAGHCGRWTVGRTEPDNPSWPGSRGPDAEVSQDPELQGVAAKGLRTVWSWQLAGSGAGDCSRGDPEAAPLTSSQREDIGSSCQRAGGGRFQRGSRGMKSSRRVTG
jgi:hypothetical protein